MDAYNAANRNFIYQQSHRETRTSSRSASHHHHDHHDHSITRDHSSHIRESYHIHAQKRVDEKVVRTDISGQLRALDEKPPNEQAEFWASCIHTQSKQLMAIGGLAPDEVYNDVVKRYFDSSVQQLDLVFDFCLRDQETETDGTLTKEGLQDAMIEHFQYYHVDEENALGERAQDCFDRLCEKIEVPVTRESFGYAIRRFRLAMLLEKYRLESLASEVYHIDYDDDRIYTHGNEDFNLRCKEHPGGSHEGVDKRMYKTVYCRQKKYNIPLMEKQEPIKDIKEYLFTSRYNRHGNVHWVHVHNKKMEMVLALGQVYRMQGHVLTAMRNLGGTQPRVRLSNAARGRQPQQSGKESDQWSSLTYPGMCLDYASKRSLQKFQRWQDNRRIGKKTTSEEPPPVYVASVEFTIGVIWSDLKTKTLVTLCSEATYIGKWMSDIPDEVQKPFWEKMLARLSCCCCCRRGRADDYEAVEQDEDDDDDSSSDSESEAEDVEKGDTKALLQHAKSKATLDLESAESVKKVQVESGMTAKDPNVSCITFDGIFEKTLLSLESQNSVLRTGNNEQLMTRIMLNSTNGYLEIVSTYGCAINRLAFLLDKKGIPNKDSLIARIETAKLELEHLASLVHPFVHNVLPSLRELHTSNDIARYQIEEIDDNIGKLMPKIETLILQCRSLAQSYDRKANDKMNSILNILTFITFIIIPMQLLTGLYGMNFRIMPELEWRYGYLWFWSLSISLSLFFALVLFRFTSEG